MRRTACAMPRPRTAGGTPAAQPQRRTAWDAAIAGYGMGSRVEYRLVPRVFGLGGPLVAMVGTNMGAGQRDRAKASHCLILAAGLRTKGSCCDQFARM